MRQCYYETLCLGVKRKFSFGLSGHSKRLTNGHHDDKHNGQNGVVKTNGHAGEKINGHAVGKMNGHVGDKVNGYSDKVGARAGKATPAHGPKLNGAAVNGDVHDTELDEFKKSHRMDLGSPKITKVAVKI